MYEQFYYVANEADEVSFRQFLVSLNLVTLPSRPGKGGSSTATGEAPDRGRMLSLIPAERVKPDPLPFPHYSAAVAPLIEWDVPAANGRVLIAGYLRHHKYMEESGEEYRQMGEAFARIRQWMKTNWKAMNKWDFIAPGAATMISEEGYEWRSFDPENTSVTIVDGDGTERDAPF